MTSRAVRAAVYARVSTGEQRVDLQLDELRQLVEQRGWVIASEYVDEAVSGTKDRRPQLDRLMAAVHAGQIDVVAVWRYDRFARTMRHLVLALDDFRGRGIDFVSVRDGIDTTTATGRFMFHVVAAFAELERELIRERTVAGLAAVRRRGQRLGRPRVHVHVIEAIRLRREGLSLRAIARRMHVALTTLRRALAASDPVPKTPAADTVADG